MKVLFLDIDGVLNSTRTARVQGGFPMALDRKHLTRFDWPAVDFVRDLCAAGDIKIVLASTWRELFPLAEIANALRLPIVDKTQSLGTRRGWEIEQYLNVHPEVTEYAIVDDEDMTPTVSERFAQTDSHDGLTREPARKLCWLFGVDPEKFPLSA